MYNKILIKNGLIVNEGQIRNANLFIEGEYIHSISNEEPLSLEGVNIIDATGMYILPGVIDDQVHFRDPGLTHKGDIYTESRAAVAGGITTYFEMPNTIPQTINQERLKEKFQIASQKSLANYSFYIGATNDNFDELIKTDKNNVCGIKIFMGSSTGNMLVDNIESLNNIFANCDLLIATHCEDETIIKNNLAEYLKAYGPNIPVYLHPKIRSEEACFKSSSLAVSLAKKYNSRLHILHLSTAKELELLSDAPSTSLKRITSEVCVHHLIFDEKDYAKKGSKIKWNPAIKKESDRLGLLKGLLNNKIDVIATDHAPHTIEEKEGEYLKSFSGGPLVQHSLLCMLELWKENKISLEKIVEKMSHSPAEIFEVYNRGYIREGYFADLTIIKPDENWTVSKENVLYKCGWSPFEGYVFSTKVIHTIVSGHHAYNNCVFDESIKGKAVKFTRE